MNSKALYTLEFDKITELLAELAPTEGSAEMRTISLRRRISKKCV